MSIFTENDIKNFLFIVPDLVKLEENKWIKECGLYDNALKFIENISKEAPDSKTLPMPPSNWLKKYNHLI
jgi:hypothetical protein